MKYSLNTLYATAGITKQGVAKYEKAKAEFENKLQALLVEADILRREHPGCGVRKMYDTLKPKFIGRDRFIDLMMGLGYRIRRKKNYLRTTIPAHYNYPNLIEGSIVTDVNLVWQSDLTFILVGRRYYYLVFILDIYSRRILGFQASDHMRTEANLQALRQALAIRKNQNLSDLIHHSDRGSQYSSRAYTKLLKQQGILISMGAKATENAYAERINGTIKNEYLCYRQMETLADLKRELRKAVKHYNTVRIHNGLFGRMSPVEFEKKIIDLSK